MPEDQKKTLSFYFQFISGAAKSVAFIFTGKAKKADFDSRLGPFYDILIYDGYFRLKVAQRKWNHQTDPEARPTLSRF